MQSARPEVGSVAFAKLSCVGPLETRQGPATEYNVAMSPPIHNSFVVDKKKKIYTKFENNTAPYESPGTMKLHRKSKKQ